MRPTETLKHEHRVIEKMLDVVEATAGRLQSGRVVDAEIFAQAADFFRSFADRCHHGKEERHLFTKLVEKGLPRESGPIAVMLAEHDQGRAHVRTLAEAAARLEAGDQTATAGLLRHALAYVELLRAHIQKEDRILFPLADRVLSEAEQEALAETFDRVEAEEMGEGVHERYHHLVHELEHQVMAEH
ncbi:MAG: hemerythrin domain-containing protein [Methanocella sp.]